MPDTNDHPPQAPAEETHMSKKIKRYHIHASVDDGRPVRLERETPYGDWCRSTDAAAIEAENARLNAANEAMRKRINFLQSVRITIKYPEPETVGFITDTIEKIEQAYGPDALKLIAAIPPNDENARLRRIVEAAEQMREWVVGGAVRARTMGYMNTAERINAVLAAYDAAKAQATTK